MSNPLNNFPYKIILASQSPRRQKLLKGLDVSFQIEVREIEESYPKHLIKQEIPLHICQQKAEAFAGDIEEKDLIITADTIVWHNESVLEKPANKIHAQEMLMKLSNSMHTVYTAVSLKMQNEQLLFFDKTDVYFKKLDSTEIDYYLEVYKPYDKAGSYGIQEWLGYTAIKKIEGCFFNVMGLPLPKLYSQLIAIKNGSL